MKCAPTPTRGSRRDGDRKRRSAGFTLAEVLAALVFMAIVIPVSIEGISIANRVGVVGERKAVAARLAESVLNELIVTGQWQSSQLKGEFDDGPPGYTWAMESETWTEDNMRVINVDVMFTVRNEEYKVRLSTLLDGQQSLQQLELQRQQEAASTEQQ